MADDVRIGVGVDGRRDAEREFDRVDQAVDKVTRGVRGLSDTAGEAGRDFTDLASDTDRQMRRVSEDVDRTVDRVNQDLRRMGQDLDQAGRDLHGLADDAEEARRGIGAAFDGLDLSAALGGALGAGIGAALPGILAQVDDVVNRVVDEFDSIDNRILASRVGLSPAEIRDYVRTLAARLPYADDEAARTALLAVDENLGGLAQTREDIFAYAEGLILLQRQGIGEATEIARAIANAGGAFGVDDPARILDLFANAVQQGADRSRDLVDTVTEYSGNLANVGLTLEDAFAIFIAGADPDRGLWNLDKVADAIRELQLRVGAGGEEVDEALREIGMLPDRVRDRLGAGGAQGRDAFADIVTGLQEVDNKARQLQLAQAIFGTPFEDLGAGDGLLGALDLTEQQLGNVSGAIQEMQAVAAGGAGQGIRGFFRSLKNEVLGVNQAIDDTLYKVRELQEGGRRTLAEAYASGDPDAIRQATEEYSDLLGIDTKNLHVIPKPDGRASGWDSDRDGRTSGWEPPAVHPHAGGVGQSGGMTLNFYGITDTDALVDEIDRTVQRGLVFGN